MLVTTLTYLLIYNITVLVLFSTLARFHSSQLKTIHSLAKFTTNENVSKILLVVFFSMAGVPPFVGFFSKVLIFILLTTSNYFLIFCFFLPTIFLGLYFYMQNIRFLNSSRASNTPHQHFFQLRQPLFYYNITIPVLVFLIFGMFYVDDLILYAT